MSTNGVAFVSTFVTTLCVATSQDGREDKYSRDDHVEFNWLVPSQYAVKSGMRMSSMSVSILFYTSF